MLIHKISPRNQELPSHLQFVLLSWGGAGAGAGGEIIWQKRNLLDFLWRQRGGGGAGGVPLLGSNDRQLRGEAGIFIYSASGGDKILTVSMSPATDLISQRMSLQNVVH